MFLAGYTYEIQYRNKKHHTNADALSRLVEQQLPAEEEEFDQVDLFHLTQFDQLLVTCATLRRETQKDRILSLVYQQAMDGWSKPDNQEHLGTLQSTIAGVVVSLRGGSGQLVFGMPVSYLFNIGHATVAFNCIAVGNFV